MAHIRSASDTNSLITGRPSTAIAIRFPDGATWLVDAGPGWEGSDEGRRTVVPWLRRQGIARLEWLITTHPDLDHIGGAGSVLAGIEVRRWGSGGPVATTAAYLDLVSGAQLAPGGQPPMPAALVAFVNPINLFKLRGPNNEQLLNQTVEDVYYVIASAYDYRSVATDRKVLLWRTRMTVASTGVSQVQTLPTLVLTAAPYLGKEMTGPQILRKRAFRNGEVEIGTPTVVESAVPAPAPQKK